MDLIALAKRARRLTRCGDLTAKQYVIYDTLLWSCGAGGSGKARVSYARLAKLAHACKASVVGAIKVFIRLGLIQRLKVRLRVVWMGGTASRQGTNVYSFPQSRTEYGPQNVIEDKEGHKDKQAANSALDDALAALQAVVTRRAPVIQGLLRP